MSFLAPWFLLGGVVVGIPVWVHLIRKQQADPIPLPSLMFFRRMPVRTMSRRQLRHLLLLAARCLLVLLLALAFARPFFPSNALPAVVGARSRLFVVMVDTSMSMRYGDRAAQAQAAARKVLAKMSALDQAQIVSFDAEARILNPPSSDRTLVTSLIDTELKPGLLPTRYGTAFSALEKMARASSLPTAAYLITDAQKTGWTTGLEMPALRPGGTFEWIAVDDRPHANWAVTDVRVAHETFQSRYPRRMQALVHGYGTPAGKKDVIFSLNGREIQKRSVDLPAGGNVTVTFDPFELPPGVSRGEIRLTPGDTLPFDDACAFTVIRREPYKLLFLSAGQDRALLYFRQALTSGDDPAFTIESRTPAQQGAASLQPYAAVVLFNLPSLPAPLPAQLKQYVEKGGGVLVAPGDRTEWGGMNSLGALLPASSGEKTYVRRDREQFITLGDFRRDHVLFQPFSGSAAAGLLSARFFGYFKVKPDDGSVLARFSTGDPALLEKTTGKGRVILLTSAPDNIWSDLPLRPGFVPLLNQTARYLGGLSDDPPYYTVPATAALGGSAVVVDPAGKRQHEELQDGSTFAKLDLIGFYEVRRGGQTGYLAANSDARESDLTPMPAEDRDLLAGRAAAASASREVELAQEKPTREDAEKRQSLWWTVLVLAVLLAIVESFAGNDMFKAPRTGTGEES